jgi:cyclic pyranopterin phosphate synthase
MVDVSGKAEVLRKATAKGIIKLKPETVILMRDGKIAKGDPFHAARIAGVLAAKKTSDIVPLCHQLPLTSVNIEVKIKDKNAVEVTTSVKTKAQTGVEMEALVATSVALLTIWDMVKQYEKDSGGQYPTTAIDTIHVVSKLKRV